jgi:lipid-A-disaccharide synthase
MPNIVLGERVVPELIQDAATPKALAAEFARFLDCDEECDRTAARLADVRRALVLPGAAERAARLVLETAA